MGQVVVLALTCVVLVDDGAPAGLRTAWWVLSGLMLAAAIADLALRIKHRRALTRQVSMVRAGTAPGPVEVRVATVRRWGLTADAERLEESSLWIAVFNADADVTAAARVLVPIDPREAVGQVQPGTSATAFGTLEPGHAVSLVINGRVLPAIGPAVRANRRSPILAATSV